MQNGKGDADHTCDFKALRDNHDLAFRNSHLRIKDKFVAVDPRRPNKQRYVVGK